MNFPSPHFLLFSETGRTLDRGQWRFVLESLDGTDKLEAADTEPDMHGERLELLAVVRGLEAVPRPSKVTLVTPSRYVNRGLNYGLAEWRTNDWQWEHFGEMTPIKNRDLWQRVDRALEFHSVDCRLWRFEANDTATGLRGDPAGQLAGPHFLQSRRNTSQQKVELATSEAICKVPLETLRSTVVTSAKVNAVSRLKSSEPLRIPHHLGSQFRRRRIRLLRMVLEFWESFCLRWRQLGSRFFPPPWLE